MTTWTDILVRDGLDDTGQIPYAGAFLTQSPDIIPQQLTTQPLAWFGQTWAQNPGLDVIAGVNNYVYVRGKNLGSAPQTGRVALYFTPTSLLMNVANWSNNPVPTGSGVDAPLVGLDGNATIQPGAVCVGNTPFLLNQQLPPGFFYCLVTRLVTTQNPNPLPVAFANTAAFVSWVVQNPDVAWRNIRLIASTNNAVSQSQHFENLDPTAETYMFVVQGTNFPNMTAVTIEGVTVGCQFKTQGYFGPPPGPQSVMIQQIVPATFAGVVNVTVTPPAGVAIPSGAALSIQFYRKSVSGDADIIHEFARRADGVGFDAKALADALGDVDVPSIVLLGACNVNVS